MTHLRICACSILASLVILLAPLTSVNVQARSQTAAKTNQYTPAGAQARTNCEQWLTGCMSKCAPGKAGSLCAGKCTVHYSNCTAP
jgi:hypothetical protein